MGVENETRDRVFCADKVITMRPLTIKKYLVVSQQDVTGRMLGQLRPLDHVKS